jgi:hypothetical protein
MNPAQRNKKITSIERLLEGSVHFVDVQLPKKAPQGRGRPKGATNKPKTAPSAPTIVTTKAKSTSSTTNKPKSTTRDPSAFKYVEKKRKRDSMLAAKIKSKQEREEKFKKRGEEEKKKKAKEETLKKKETAAPSRTRPVRKAAARSNPLPEPPKKKIHTVQITSRLPIEPPAPKAKFPEPQTPEDEEAPVPKRPLCEAWEDSSYVDSLPAILLDYVDTTLNVDSDGHFEFQVAAHCLGQGQNQFPSIREELYQQIVDNRRFYEVNAFFPNIDATLRRIKFPDLTVRCDIPNWMCMPSMGDPLAKAFECPVFFFSKNCSQSFFPAMCPPSSLLFPVHILWLFS